MGEDARILGVHGGHGRDAARLRLDADGRTGQPVPARVEGGARHDEPGLEGRDGLSNGLDGLVLVLHHVVVAADHGGDNRARVSKGKLKRAPGADGLVAHLHAHIGVLLSSDPSKELVDEVEYPDGLSHVSPPEFQRANSP